MEFKWPGSGSAAVAFTPVWEGIGSAVITTDVAIYQVRNGWMDLLVKGTNSNDGSGVAAVTLQIPGGYSYDDSLIQDADTWVGNFAQQSVTFASSTTLQFAVLNGFTVDSPFSGSDLTTGEVYTIRARFPVK